jgi:hypothetical protein
VTLDNVFWQDGQRHEKNCFFYLLMNVRDAMPIVEESKLLMTHMYTSLASSTKESFDKNIHLFVTNNDVKNHNKHCLR